jgi:argininosuccinate synthase
VLEDPWQEAPEYIYSRTKSIKDSREVPDEIVISFKEGDAVAINEKNLKPHELLTKLNEYGYEHGIGREDIVENRFVGMKSRGIYETPGGTILAKAHRAIESITLDRGEAHLKDEIMPKYAEIIYNGLWFSSERIAMQNLIDSTQKNVTGDVKLKLIKGNVIVVGRRSPLSRYNLSLVSFDEVGDYDQKDAEGFIKITSLRLKK